MANLCRAIILAGIMIGFLAPGSGAAQDDHGIGADQQAVFKQIIQSQIAAFQRDDGIAAFSFAAPGIRSRFGTPDNFMHMVRSGYPAVYRPRGVAFMEARLKDGRPYQAVRFVGPDGRGVIALYEMQKQPDGSWKIAGVYLVPIDDRTS